MRRNASVTTMVTMWTNHKAIQGMDTRFNRVATFISTSNGADRLFRSEGIANFPRYDQRVTLAPGCDYPRGLLVKISVLFYGGTSDIDLLNGIISDEMMKIL